MTEPLDPSGEGVLVRRMRKARLRQWLVAVFSVAMAAIGVTFLTPAALGPFAYYALLGLMLLNATIAVRQCIHVLFPIETLLRKIRQIERRVDKGELDPGHFSIHANDAFACLTAGIDSLVTKLSERGRAASEQASRAEAMIQAVPFAAFTVSRTGRVYAIIRDQFGLVDLLGLKVGFCPSADSWGETNATRFLKAVGCSFDSDEFRWFDLDVDVHHLRGSVKRIGELTALVLLGDMPCIDQIVADMTGAASESDFSSRQNTLKRFAATIAHDARNVLASLGNLVEVNKASTDSAVREQTAIAEDAIRRGTILMDELTSFAGDASYRLVCTPAAEGLRAIFESPTILALFPKNVKMLLSVSDEKMPEIDLAADQMWKVGCNLVKNAIEAMNGNDGRIWISVEPCLLSEEAARSFRHACTLRTGEGVLITVTDDGPGIEPNMIGHLFDPYASSKGASRGLGLATVMTIVDAHGGAISVKSSPGYGTTFYLFLPASRNTAEEIQLMQQVAPNGEILLVDDDPTILHTTGLVLKSLKIAAHPAANGEDALKKLRTLRTRLRAVLVDANIRCASSASLVATIRAEFPELPVIVVSGSPEETVARQYGCVRYDRFLAKPYSVGELSQALNEVAPKK